MDGDLRIARDILRHLANAVATAMLYTPEHVQVLARIPLIVDPLRQALSHSKHLTFLMIKGEILLDGKPLEKAPHIERLARTCAERQIGHITFAEGVEAADLRQLVRCITGSEALEVLQHDFSKIRIGGVTTEQDDHDDLETFAPIESFDQLSSTQLKGLAEVYSDIAQQGPLDIQNIAALVGGLIAAFKREANPLMALVPLRSVDDYSFTHSVNVGILNIAQGMSLGIEGHMRATWGWPACCTMRARSLSTRRSSESPASFRTRSGLS